jgi:hypothetical protein
MISTQILYAMAWLHLMSLFDIGRYRYMSQVNELVRKSNGKVAARFVCAFQAKQNLPVINTIFDFHHIVVQVLH